MTAHGRINYVRHLNGFYRQVQKDTRLHANHIALYVALFQIWNQHRFINPFPIIRENVISLCRIGSYNTYTQCLKALHDFGYILYQPAERRGMPSRISVKYLAGTAHTISQQLLLFDDDHSSRKNDTAAKENSDQVNAEIATGSSRNIKRDAVAKLRSYNKQINKIQTESENTHSLRKKNQRKSEMNKAVETPEKQLEPPELDDVKKFFVAHSYPPREASKFFYHYKANGWLQAGKVPIVDWHAAAHKWILNVTPQKTSNYDNRTPAAGQYHTNQDKSYSDPL